MPPIVVENAFANSSSAEPGRHWRYDAQAITDQVVAGRRKSDRLG